MIHRTLLIAMLAGAAGASPAVAGPEATEPAPAAHDEAMAHEPPDATAPAMPAPAERPARFMLMIENDGVIKPEGRADRYYTSGVKVDLSLQPVWAQPFATILPLGADFDPTRTAFGVSAAQMIFTPYHNNRPKPPPDDHPYAGYLYGSVYLQRAEQPSLEFPDHRSIYDHLQLDFGVVGQSSLAEESQKEVHRVIGERILKGWSHQLKDEPAINVTFRRKVRLEYALGESTTVLQFIPEIGFDAGTVWRQAVGGVTVRIGQNLPDDYGPSRMLLSGAAVAAPPEGFGWEVYARCEGHIVQHDIFLDGNTWRDSASVEKNLLVGELTIGSALHLGANFDVGYSQTFQTEQFEGQDGMHSWGTLFIRAYWTF